MGEVLLQFALCVAWGLAAMGVMIAGLFVFGCVMSAITHKDFEPYEWPHYVGFTIITLAVLAIMGALIRPDWSI
jgi:cytochrome b561